MYVVVWSASWIEELICVQMDHPFDVVLESLLKGHFHVQCLHDKQFMVTRFVEECPEPGFVPGTAVGFHMIELVVISKDFHTSPFFQFLASSFVICLSIREEIEIRDANGRMIFNPELRRIHITRSGCHDGNLDA